jgi:hypothetical protein
VEAAAAVVVAVCEADALVAVFVLSVSSLEQPARNAIEGATAIIDATIVVHARVLVVVFIDLSPSLRRRRSLCRWDRITSSTRSAPRARYDARSW